MSKLAVLCALLALVALASATIGVDVSTQVSTSTFQCMRNNGVRFMISRVYRETGTCDAGGAASIRNARAAGIKYTDGYIYPSLRQSPKAQIDSMLNCLKGTNFGMIWLDVEGKWTSSRQTNINIIAGLAKALEARRVNYGVYTNANGWNSITGGWTGMAHRPLWWANWDGSPSWSHWRSFGGWSKPAMKQYRGDTALCGAGVDMNFY